MNGVLWSLVLFLPIFIHAFFGHPARMHTEWSLFDCIYSISNLWDSSGVLQARVLGVGAGAGVSAGPTDTQYFDGGKRARG